MKRLIKYLFSEEFRAILFFMLIPAAPFIIMDGFSVIWYFLAFYAIIISLFYLDKFIYNSLYYQDRFSDWIIIIIMAPTMLYSIYWLIGFIIKGLKREFSENRIELIGFAISTALLIYIWKREKKANTDRDVFKRNDFN